MVRLLQRRDATTRAATGGYSSSSSARLTPTKAGRAWATGWGLATVATILREYRPFREARAFARKLKLKSGAEWRAFCKGEMPRLGQLPADIPAHPDRTYADKGWKGMGDWLGTGTVASRLRQYRPFLEARAFARRLKLKSASGMASLLQRRDASAGATARGYSSKSRLDLRRQGLEGHGRLAGDGQQSRPRLKEYRPFREARAFARKLKLKRG